MSHDAISPLRRRMIEDMAIRQFGEKTRRDYIRQVRAFTAVLGRSRTGPNRRTSGATSSTSPRSARATPA
jgi:hypothetical protein